MEKMSLKILNTRLNFLKNVLIKGTLTPNYNMQF